MAGCVYTHRRYWNRPGNASHCQGLHVFLVPNWGVVRIVSTREPCDSSYAEGLAEELVWVRSFAAGQRPRPRAVAVGRLAVTLLVDRLGQSEATTHSSG